jgi:hypothetical protein
MARLSQIELNDGPDLRYKPRDARRESWVDLTGDWPASLPFNTQLMVVRT